MKTLLALILLCTTSVQAQILIYKRTVHTTTMGNGFKAKTSVSGYLILNAATGAAAEFDIDSRAKTFLGRSRSFSVGTVHAGPGKEYMVLADAVAGTDTFGPYRWSTSAKGTSVPLDIGWEGKQPFPRTMRLIGWDVHNFGTEHYIEEDAGTLVIDLVDTRSINAAGRTLDDVASALRSNLIDEGYRDAQPTIPTIELHSSNIIGKTQKSGKDSKGNFFKNIRNSRLSSIINGASDRT